MYLLKNKNISFIILISGIFLLLCLPNSFKEILSISFFEISFLVFSIIYIPFLVKGLIQIKINEILKLVFMYIFLCVLTCFVSEDFIFQRLIISIVYFVPLIILYSVKWDSEKLAILKYFALFSFFFLSLQVILSSLGLVKFNSVETGEIGAYKRVGTTAGVATFTAPVIVLLFAIVDFLSKKRIVKYSTLLILIVAVFLSGTRSTLLLLIFVFITYAFFVLTLKYKFVLLLSFLVLAPLVDTKFKVLETLEARNKNAKDYSDGDVTSGRVERWNVIFNRVKESPEILLTGIGGANTPYFNKFLKTNLQANSSPHNVYLGVLYEHGVLLLLLFMFIIYKLIKNVIHEINLSTLIFIFIFLLTYNTEVFPLGSSFSSLVFILYILLSNKNIVKIRDSDI